MFSGAVIGSGTYTIRVNAYSSLLGSSGADKVIKVSGTRAAAPEVSFEPAEFRSNQTTTFTIDTTDCEEVYVRYNGYGNGYNWGSSYSITPTGNVTKWTYQFSEDAMDANFSFNFTVKKNGKWTYSKEIKQTVLGLPPLDPAVIHVDDTIEAGADFTISIDPVENASEYYFGLYKPNGEAYYGAYIEPSVRSRTINGYESIEPGDYTVRVRTYSNDYATSISEKAISIVGTKPSAPAVSVDKTEYYSNETRPIFTVQAYGAEAIRCSNGSVVIPDEDGYASFSPSIYLGDRGESVGQFSFCFVKNKIWSEWSEPISIKIKRANIPEPEPLNAPVINLPDNITAGNDFTFSFNEVDGATSYTAYIRYYYVDSSIYSNYSAEAGTNISVSGRLLTAGRYKAIVSASAEGRTSSSSEVEFTVTGERGIAPVVTADKTECIGGETVTFNIDTEDVGEVYVTYNSQGNYGTSGQRTINPEANTTEWTYTVPSYFYGTTYTFSFNVKRNGTWSKTKAITIQVPDQSGQ